VSQVTPAAGNPAFFVYLLSPICKPNLVEKETPLMSSFLKPALHSAASLSLLTLSALLAAPAVQAQGLTLGAPAGSPGASGSGTVSGSGTTVSGNYAFSGGAGTATANYSSVDAYGAGSAASTVALQPGGSIAALTLYNDSQALVTCGSITTLVTGFGTQPDPFNKAGFSITGGSVGTISHNSEGGVGSIGGGTVGSVTAFSDLASILQISGGTVGTATISSQRFTSKATISGGSIGTFNLDGSNLSMSGGDLGSLSFGITPEGSTGTLDASNATISGGHVSALSAMGGFEERPDFLGPLYATCTIQGGTFGTLAAAYYGGYNIDGSDLRLFTNGEVTGTLSDGEALNAQYTNGDGNGFIDFNGVAAVPQAVPEASTTVSLGLLLMLGAGGMVLARRRSVTAPSA